MKKILRVLVVAALLIAIAIPCLAAETCDHNWTKVESPSTCKVEGKVTYTCSKCGTSYEEPIAKKAHTWGAWVEVDKATCKDQGKEERECTVCGDKEEKIIATTGKHTPVAADPSYTQNNVPASCYKDGYVVKTRCSVCSAILTKETIPATGNHEYAKYTKQPTCGEDGYTTLVCTTPGCNHEKEGSRQPIKATGKHTLTGDKYIVSEATCEKAKVVYQVCSVCKQKVEKTEGSKLGHNLTWTTVTEATCTEKGSKTAKCERCDYTETKEIAALGHKKSSKAEILTPAACGKGSVGGFKCTRCGEVLESWTNTADALTHVEKTTVVEPTCTAEGTATTVCERCGATLKTVTLEKLDHDFEWKAVKEGKPCEDYEETETCKVCGATGKTRTVKASKEHKFPAAATVIKAATCTEDGLKGIACSVCGAVKEGTTTEKIPATGHTPGEWELVRKPSATQDGKKIQKCTVCGVQLGKKYIPATGSTSTKTSGKTIAFVKGEEVADYAKIDLSKDAITELDLVDAKGAKVGKLVVEVKEGTVTVKYELSAVPTEAFLTFVNEAPSKDITAEKAYEFEKAISVADELAGAAAAYIYVKIEF